MDNMHFYSIENAMAYLVAVRPEHGLHLGTVVNRTVRGSDGVRFRQPILTSRKTPVGRFDFESGTESNQFYGEKLYLLLDPGVLGSDEIILPRVKIQIFGWGTGKKPRRFIRTDYTGVGRGWKLDDLSGIIPSAHIYKFRTYVEREYHNVTVIKPPDPDLTPDSAVESE